MFWFLFVLCLFWKCRAHPHRTHLRVYTCALFPTCSSPASCPESEQQFRGFQCCGLFLVIKASFSGCFSHCGVTTVLEKDFKWLQTATLPTAPGKLLPRTEDFQRETADLEGEDLLVHLHCFPHRQLRVVPGSLSFVLFELSPSLAHSKSRQTHFIQNDFTHHEVIEGHCGCQVDAVSCGGPHWMMNLVIQEECRVEKLLLHIQRKQMRWLSQTPEEDPGCEGGVLSSGWLEEEPELMVERRRSGCLCPHSKEWTATCGHVQKGASSKMNLNNYFLTHPALVTSDITEVKMCEATPGSLRLIFTFWAEPRCCHWREDRGNRSRSRASGFMSLSIMSASKGCGMKMSHGSVWLRLRLALIK